jgi:hypothetical protein
LREEREWATRMKVNLQPELTEQVLALTQEFGYAPGEIIGIGIALAKVLLREKGAGNQVVVLNPQGETVAEFVETEPQALNETVRNYLRSVCPEMAEAPPALVVAKLERERDVEAGRRR